MKPSKVSYLWRSRAISIILLVPIDVRLVAAQISCPNTDVKPYRIEQKAWTAGGDQHPSLAITLGDDNRQQQVPVAICLRLNDTYVWSADYNSAKSSGWTQIANMSDTSFSLPYEYPDSSGVLGNDTFRILSTTTTEFKKLTNFPFYVISKWNREGQAAEPNAIGFNAGSTLLERMWKNKFIPGKGFGLSLGILTGKKDRVKGEMILGGYNNARIDGKVYQQDILYNNLQIPGWGSLVVKVADILLDFNNGTAPASVFTALNEENKQNSKAESDWSFDAQLETRIPYLEFPTDVAYKIMNMAKFVWANQATGFTKAPSDFTGSLIIRLDNGFEVTIPTETFTRAWPSTGDTASPLRVYKQFPGETKFAMLGYHYLAETYLWVNYETRNGNRAGTFGLAKLKRNSEEEIVSFCADKPPTEEQQQEDDKNNNGGNNGSNNNNQNEDNTSNDPDVVRSKSSGLKGGPIAGIVVGSVMGLLILAGLAFWCFRRRRNTPLAVELASEAPPIRQGPTFELGGDGGANSLQGSPEEGFYGQVANKTPGELPVREYVHPKYPGDPSKTPELSSLRSPRPGDEWTKPESSSGIIS